MSQRKDIGLNTNPWPVLLDHYNGTPEIEVGERYNIGYSEDGFGNKVVDLSCLSKNSEVNPNISYLFASQFSAERSRTNRAKNDERVTHEASEGYYWGKKYARREYGLVISKGAFYGYLDEIGHPRVNCLTVNPNLGFTNNEQSVAYLDDGLEEAMAELIKTAKKVTKVMYKSPLYSKRFSIRGITAISDKK